MQNRICWNGTSCAGLRPGDRWPSRTIIPPWLPPRAGRRRTWPMRLLRKFWNAIARSLVGDGTYIVGVRGDETPEKGGLRFDFTTLQLLDLLGLCLLWLSWME